MNVSGAQEGEENLEEITEQPQVELMRKEATKWGLKLSDQEARIADTLRKQLYQIRNELKSLLSNDKPNHHPTAELTGGSSVLLTQHLQPDNSDPILVINNHTTGLSLQYTITNRGFGYRQTETNHGYSPKDPRIQDDTDNAVGVKSGMVDGRDIILIKEGAIALKTKLQQRPRR